jgi:hypothetical protein
MTAQQHEEGRSGLGAQLLGRQGVFAQLDVLHTAGLDIPAVHQRSTRWAGALVALNHRGRRACAEELESQQLVVLTHCQPHHLSTIKRRRQFRRLRFA